MKDFHDENNLKLTVKSNGKKAERRFDRSSVIIKFNVHNKNYYIIYRERVNDAKSVIIPNGRNVVPIFTVTFYR